MNRRRVLSILWSIEIILGVLPAIILLGMALISNLVLLQVVPQALQDGETAAMRTVLLITGMTVGGILGVASILMAYRPETLRQRPKRRDTLPHEQRNA